MVTSRGRQEGFWSVDDAGNKVWVTGVPSPSQLRKLGYEPLVIEAGTKPPEPKFYTAAEAKDIGLDMPTGWQAKVGYTPDFQQVVTFVSPQGGEYKPEDVFAIEMGQWVTSDQLKQQQQFYTDIQKQLTAAQEEYLKEVPAFGVEKGVLTPEQRALEAQYRGYQYGLKYPEEVIKQQRINEYLGLVYPYDEFIQTPQQIKNWIGESEQNTQQFLQDVGEIGRTPQMEYLVQNLFEGATQQDIESVFASLSGVPQEFREEGWLKDNLIDPFIVGGNSFISGIKQTVTSIVPALFVEGREITTGGGKLLFKGFPEEWYDLETKIKSDILKSAEERFLRYSQQNDQWLMNHPELTPKPEYQLNPFQNTSLFLDPGYYFYNFTNSLAYSLGVMGSIVATTAATGGNVFLGLGAGFAVAGMPETSNMTRQLLEQGVPFNEAIKWGVLYGSISGGVESVSDLPLLGILFKPIKQVIQPFWKTLTRLTANNIVKATIATAVIPSIEGMEEAITQATQNAILKHYDETQSLLKGIDQSFIQGVIASLPFALIGGTASYRSFREALPADVRENMDELVDKYVKSGATEEQAQVIAANEMAKTPQGEQAISQALDKIKPVEIPSGLPGDYLTGDAFTTPKGDIELSYFSRQDGKWAVDMPDGTQQKFTSEQMNALVESKDWIYKFKEEAETPSASELRALHTDPTRVKGLRNSTREEAVTYINRLKKFVKAEGTPEDMTKINQALREAQEGDLGTAGVLADDVLTSIHKRFKISHPEFELVITPAVTVKPLPPPPEPAISPLGERMPQAEHADEVIRLFSNYINHPSAKSAWELTKEMRREDNAQRAENLRNRAEQLIVEEGIDAETAMNQAINESLSGQRPALTQEYLSQLTDDMRKVLFSRVYETLKDEPFEMTSTVTALTNALAGRPIPREPGVRGGSAFTRLQRVFGAEEMKALETISEQGKSLEDVVNGFYKEVIEGGAPPIPIADRASVEYLRAIGKKVKTAEDLAAIREYYREHPAAKFEGPIEDAAKQMPLFPRPATDTIVRILKEIGWSPIDIGNFIRANLASGDLSFLLRQLIWIVPRHPSRTFDGLRRGWSGLWSQKSAEATDELVTRFPVYPVYAEGVAQGHTDFLRPLKMRKGTKQWMGTEEFAYLTEERLIPRLTGKIPTVKMSNRGFVSGINPTLMGCLQDKYDSLIREAEQYASGRKKLKAGEVFDINREIWAHQDYLGEVTGRARLGKLQTLAPVLNALFFAPRYKLGRILTPRHLFSSNARVRAEAWKDAASFIGLVGGIIMLGYAADWWDVEFDPKSTDFMKIRIGNTRIDPWGGYQQLVVFVSQLFNKIGVSSTTGQEYNIGLREAIWNFLGKSAAPLVSLFMDLYTGETFKGVKLDIKDPEQWMERLIPIALQDIYEAFKDSGLVMAGAVALPAFLGVGVQTYTGKWEDNWQKLGLPKYEENLPYGITEPYYDTSDFWADTASQFRGVDPASLTEAKGYPPYIRAIAESLLILEYMESLPNQTLANLNTDPTKGPTFADYYSMWQEREGITDEEALKAFDQDERTRNAYLGNFSQRQLALLYEYYAISGTPEGDKFLEEHKDEIGINPRVEYLKSHPKENAQLAIWGKADILTKEAYGEFKQLMSSLDIPDNAVITLLPPESSIDTHFAYKDMVTEGTYQSWVAKLLIKQDAIKAKELGVKSYAEWANLQVVDTPLNSLLIKTDPKFLDIYNTIDSMSDKTSPQYIVDDEQRALEIQKLKDTVILEGYTYRDMERRIEIIEMGTDNAPISETLINAHTEYGRLLDQEGMGPNSPEAIIFRYQHPDYNAFRMDMNYWGENALSPIDESKIPIWQLDVQLAEQDAKYDSLKTTAERQAYLEQNRSYWNDRLRRQAYQLEIPYRYISNYLDWNQMTKPANWKAKTGTDLWYEDDWFLIENDGFYKEVYLGIFGNQKADFRTVPSRDVFDKYLEYLSLPEGNARKNYRFENIDLDDWLVIKFGYTPIRDQLEDIITPSPQEQSFEEYWDSIVAYLESQLK